MSSAINGQNIVVDDDGPLMQNSMRALVTGADGFFGSHLVELLVREGYPVTASVYTTLMALGVGLIIG